MDPFASSDAAFKQRIRKEIWQPTSINRDLLEKLQYKTLNEKYGLELGRNPETDALRYKKKTSSN